MKVLKWLCLVGCLWFLLGATEDVNDDWDTSYENVPGPTDSLGLADDMMRDAKQETRNRSRVEMQFGSPGSEADNGMMRLGSARCFMQNTAPTATVVAAFDNGSGVAADASANLIEDEVNLSPARLVGEGRCWVDLDGPDNTTGTPDDYTVYFYHGTDEATADGAWRSFHSLGPMAGARNLVYGGSFEQTDGTGDDSSTTVPQGWTILGVTPTFTYANPPTTESDGLEVVILAVGSTNQGITQTFDALKASTTYLVVGRAQPASAGADSCSIVTTGGSTNVDSTIATGAAYVHLGGTFLTDATPTPVVLRLESDADGDTCSWDHIGLFELNGSNQPSPGTFVVSATDATASAGNCQDSFGTAGNCDDIINVWITPPGDNYILWIEAEIQVVQASSTLVDCYARIYDGSTALDTARYKDGIHSGGAPSIASPIRLHAVVINPVPGAEINIQVDVHDNITGACEVAGDGAATHKLKVLAIPGG